MLRSVDAEVTRELTGCLRSPRTLLLPDVGHLPNLEATDWFNEELVQFLRSTIESSAT